jgi:hypothetical protein
MKFLIAFVLCFFCISFETSAVYSVEKQGIAASHTPVFTPERLTYKERVMQKYRQLKAAPVNRKKRLFIASAIFLLLGLGLTFAARKSNQASPPNGFIGTNDGCLKAVLALVSFATSIVLFVVALFASV